MSVDTKEVEEAIENLTFEEDEDDDDQTGVDAIGIL
jgi:hypothetical protein